MITETGFSIDWDNLPTCGEQLTVSPYICAPPGSYTPPVETPTPVSAPGTLVLMAIGLMLLMRKRAARHL